MEPVRNNPRAPAWFASYAHIRTDGYVVLSSLLGQPPSEELLHILRNLVWEESLPENLDAALKALRQAERDTAPAVTEDEFNRLFVGLGRGQMLPYASWYRERKIQSLPLASLRADLMQLGIIRQTNCHEPEDSAAALCEIMALISGKAKAAPPAQQAKFFQTHIASWMPVFFRDLQSTTSSAFYRAVGSFGTCFLESEAEYLKSLVPELSL
jgi:TorA maturation chaperone TorD